MRRGSDMIELQFKGECFSTVRASEKAGRLEMGKLVKSYLRVAS